MITTPTHRGSGAGRVTAPPAPTLTADAVTGAVPYAEAQQLTAQFLSAQQARAEADRIAAKHADAHREAVARAAAQHAATHGAAAERAADAVRRAAALIAPPPGQLDSGMATASGVPIRRLYRRIHYPIRPEKANTARKLTP